ncbi:PREDICTED: root meristem growth factor 9-like [Camelina sativa]|uniref:Root meristem growth factor 9-like n=1 Tax=Camelina sativa TaxID=90675 RepID=A0ABM0VXX4_CAMSA|nr:PREDICTED: root meristem growth factor 9-like [Camelina sativa]
MAIRVSNKSLLVALLLILFISSPTQARSLREIVRKRTVLVVEKGQESQKLRHEGGGSDIDGLVDMDYNSANKKRPIHNR